MEAKEVRLRCIEAISTMGIREPSRLIRDAEALEKWVNDTADAPRVGRPKAADKG